MPLAVLGAIGAIIFGSFLGLSWKRQWVWVRSERIERRSDALAYWLAMGGWALTELAMVFTFASNLYVTLKR